MPPVVPVLQSGILPRLVQLLSCGDAKVMFEAAWAVTNIASTEHTQTVVDAGAVPPLVQGMMAADANLREQCMWCIGNVSGEGPHLRDMLIGTPGCVEALLQNLAYPGNVSLLRNATWTLSNLCRGKPSPSIDFVTRVLPALAFLTSHADQATVIDAVWGLSYLTDGDDATINAVVSAPDVVKRCVELMQHQAIEVVTPALRVIGNLISGNDRCTQAAVDAGALAKMVPLLSNSRKTIRREACWAISNIAAGTLEQITAMMLVPGLVQAVLMQLQAGEWAVRKEACWVIFNVATSGRPEHVSQMVAAGAIDPLSAMLKSDDARILVVALDAVGAVLDVSKKLDAANSRLILDAFEEAGAVDELEHLQNFSDTDVYEKAINLIEKHFPSEEEGGDADDELAENFHGSGTLSAAAASLGGFGSAGAPCAAPTAGFPQQMAFSFGGPGTVAGQAAPSAGFKTPPGSAAPPTGFSAMPPAAPAFNFGAFSFS